MYLYSRIKEQNMIIPEFESQIKLNNSQLGVGKIK